MKEAPAGKGVAAPATTIATVLVDDEQLAREELAYLLRVYSDIEIVGQGRNGLEAVNLIRDLEPDLVFLDVKMPGLDGLGVVRRLREKKIPIPHIVFATAFDEYAVEAFNVDAVDYLLKPYDAARLAKSVERVRKTIETRLVAESPATAGPEMPGVAPRTHKIVVRSQNRMILVDAAELVYATIEDGIISVVASELEGFSNYRTLEELQSALPAETFWRVHRSYLVNINQIKEVVPWFKSSFLLKLNDKKQTQVPVSRTQTRRLRELLKL